VENLIQKSRSKIEQIINQAGDPQEMTENKDIVLEEFDLNNSSTLKEQSWGYSFGKYAEEEENQYPLYGDDEFPPMSIGMDAQGRYEVTGLGQDGTRFIVGVYPTWEKAQEVLAEIEGTNNVSEGKENLVTILRQLIEQEIIDFQAFKRDREGDGEPEWSPTYSSKAPVTDIDMARDLKMAGEMELPVVDATDNIPGNFTGIMRLQDGTEQYMKDGKLHRGDGPAYTDLDGIGEWFFDGRFYGEGPKPANFPA